MLNICKCIHELLTTYVQLLFCTKNISSKKTQTERIQIEPFCEKKAFNKQIISKQTPVKMYGK